MVALPTVLKTIGGKGKILIHQICFAESPSYESPHKEFIDKNMEEFDKIVENWAKKECINIRTRKEDHLYIGDYEIEKHYKNSFDFSSFTDISVDISSLTKSLYFPLLNILVKKSLKIQPIVNIFVVACHDADFDSKIIESADDIRSLKGFRGKLGRLGLQDVPVIWAPILEKNNSVSLRKLHERIEPKDIYPILPFPSQNPRTDDNLLIEYNQILVDEWKTNPLNIIYAAENDPVDVYRSLMKLYQQQQEALDPLGGILMVVSALSSKLSSVGAFMAACKLERKMTIMHAIGRHVPPEGMDLSFWDEKHVSDYQNNLHSIWLTGEPYE